MHNVLALHETGAEGASRPREASRQDEIYSLYAVTQQNVVAIDDVLKNLVEGMAYQASSYKKGRLLRHRRYLCVDLR